MTDNVYQGDDFDAKVIKQVEFYFSDSNLQTDRFLWKIYESNEGWVELKTILTFGRMRQYRPEEKVIEALKKSEKLILSANNEMIKRKEPLKDFNELKNSRKKNSIHIEGFPKDLSQEDLEEFFNTKVVDHLPKEKAISSIRRARNRRTKEFFGVIDVEFNTQEDAQYFLDKMEITYPQGLVTDDVDQKDVLKKMTLLTFQEMRENGKRFGINDVTKRKNSFSKDGKRVKIRKEDTEEAKEDTEEAKEETKEDTETKEEAKEETEN